MPQMIWQGWFAWHPVLIGTRIIWLKRVNRRWNTNSNYSLDQYGYGCCLGGWEYKL